MNLSLHPIALLFLATALACVAGPGRAQDFPSKPVRIVVPSAAGSGTDLMARVALQGMAKPLGQPVIIDNRPGGSSIIGTDYVAKHVPADGYTLLLASPTILMIPLFNKDAPSDPARELVPISIVGEIPFVLAANASMPFNTFAEFIAYARANPGKINYGTPGLQTTTSLWLEFLKYKNKVDIVNITYQGSGQIYTALLTNTVNMTGGITAGQATTGAKEGKLKPLAVSGKRRLPGLPDVPSYAELGYPEILNANFYLFAPAATPRPIIDRLYAAVAATLQTQEAKEGFAKLGFGIVGANPDASAKEYAYENAIYTSVVKNSGLGPK